MRGRIVNLCAGFMNLMFGVLIIIFTAYIPQDKTLLTIQENYVVGYILKGIYIVLGLVAFLNLIQYYNHKRNNAFNKPYLFSLAVLSFIFIKEPVIAALPILAGFTIIMRSVRENLVEIDSTSGISITISMIAVIGIMCGICLFYTGIAQNIKNKENKNELAYKEDYFKYVTELNMADIYINMKKDGKYGYINQNGEVKIDFVYDYASPFVKINMYNKNFEIALVCKEGSTYIILKNERKVLSYRTESSDENYATKAEELENVYKNILQQTGEMKFEVSKITENINRVPAYDEVSNDYTYRYNYNEEYDLIVTQSDLGLGDKYELAKKEDINIKIGLDADNLSYDEKFLYLFSNGQIPFYEIKERKQGWFTSYGTKKEMQGKAQILEFIDDKILIKNYNDYTTYFIDYSGKMLSEPYKEIYICGDRYIVKGTNNRCKVVDKDFNKVFEHEFDAIDTHLAAVGVYVGLIFDKEIEFNDYGFAKMNWIIVGYNGQVITNDVEQIYSNYFQLSSDKSYPYNTRYAEFVTELKKIKYNFVGDSFYAGY